MALPSAELETGKHQQMLDFFLSAFSFFFLHFFLYFKCVDIKKLFQRALVGNILTGIKTAVLYPEHFCGDPVWCF